MRCSLNVGKNIIRKQKWSPHQSKCLVGQEDYYAIPKSIINNCFPEYVK